MSRKKKTIEVPDKLVEGWEKAEQAIGENADLLSERTYSLAAGGLALSFTVMSFIVGEDKSALDWQALAIWGFFLLCIILDTISIFSAKRKAEKLELFFREKKNQGHTMPEIEVNKMIDHTNRSINRFNMIVFILLLITIVWTFIYSYLLLIKVSSIVR